MCFFSEKAQHTFWTLRREVSFLIVPIYIPPIAWMFNIVSLFVKLRACIVGRSLISALPVRGTASGSFVLDRKSWYWKHLWSDLSSLRFCLRFHSKWFRFHGAWTMYQAQSWSVCWQVLWMYWCERKALNCKFSVHWEHVFCYWYDILDITIRYPIKDFLYSHDMDLSEARWALNHGHGGGVVSPLPQLCWRLQFFFIYLQSAKSFTAKSTPPWNADQFDPCPHMVCATAWCFGSMILQVVTVLGSQWGDEGKGKLVDILAQKMDIVARAQVSFHLNLNYVCGINWHQHSILTN